MTFAEVIQMAEQIRAHYPRLDLRSVGQFRSPRDTTSPERWGVLVRIDGGEARVLWSRDELIAFSSAEPRRSNPKPRTKPVAEDAGVPLLF